MADFYAETAKVLLPALLGVLSGYFVKVRLEQRERDRKDVERWYTQKQSHWSPLLEAARELKDRFDHLSYLLHMCIEPVNCRSRHECGHRDKCTGPVSRESFFQDCCELYMISRNEIKDFQQCHPNEPRSKDKEAVQRTRERMCHELTFAVSSVYKTAKYLGLAERVRRDLKGDLLMLDDAQRDEMVSLIEGVRKSLQGEGAGIFVEQQESIAEMVWDPARGVITNFEFRQRLLKTPDWEQFTNLLRFFVDFEKKLDHEVNATIRFLPKLIDKVGQLCSSSSKSDYEARCRSQASGTGGLPTRAPSGSA